MSATAFCTLAALSTVAPESLRNSVLEHRSELQHYSQLCAALRALHSQE